MDLLHFANFTAELLNQYIPHIEYQNIVIYLIDNIIDDEDMFVDTMWEMFGEPDDFYNLEDILRDFILLAQTINNEYDDFSDAETVICEN